MKVTAARRVGQLGHDSFLGQRILGLILRLDAKNNRTAERSWCAGVASWNQRIKAARIQRADPHIGANRAIHDLGLFLAQIVLHEESGGNEDQAPIARGSG